jgi:hypothetical protein
MTTARRAAPHDRLPLQRMLELYQHDLSDIWDQDLDRHGEYGYPLDRYWADPRCVPYVFLVDDSGGEYVETRIRSGWWQGYVQSFVSRGPD